MNKLINKDPKYIFFGKKFYDQKEAAEYFGVSIAMISAVFSGKKPPSKPMLDKVGYFKTVTTTTEYSKK